MLYLLAWWVLLLLLGLIALPLTTRFLRFLPDRGYAFAKPLALLLWVYPFWLLASFGFLRNSLGALLAVLILFALVSWEVLRGRGADSVGAWLRANWRYALVVEAVFTVAYLGFAYFRAYNPEISGTEKPMEFMFLNSILASDTFPPRDAWLSGYAISYYYLGYVIVAALATLANTPSSYAFNLGLITTYGLAAVGAFGVAYNLVRYAQNGRGQEWLRSRAPYAFGIIAVVFLLVMGNLEGAFEAGYNAGIGPRDYYASLNLHGLGQIEPSGSLIPKDNWWWWRASRVLNDVNPADGSHAEVIDEFPAFSFLLGDLHPHVLALPFGILALAVAFNVLVASTAVAAATDSKLGSLVSLLMTPRTLLTVLVVGALGMLNTWDIVTYGLVVAAAFAISQYRAAGKLSWSVVVSSVAYLLVLYIGGYLLFLPFYLGFSSQARGIAPNIFNRTPLHQYLIMFGVFVFVIASFVLVLLARQPDKKRALANALQFAVPLLVVPVVIAAVGFVVVARNAELQQLIASTLNVAPDTAAPSVLGAFARSFLASPGVFLLLVLLISGVAALGQVELAERSSDGLALRTGVIFALLLALVGLVLTFGVEFLYIRDTFESRMNTVFKLYYQAWLLFAVAATFGVYYVWQASRGVARGVWLGALGVLVSLSLIYPVLAYPNRANNFQSNEAAATPTLDGWRWVRAFYPDEYAAIEWVRANVPRDAVILEGAGSQYSFDNRISVATGRPTVLGWGGHELQWRGSYDEAGSRENDIEQIYRSRSVNETRDLLHKYNVDYVVVGDQERDKYDLNTSLVEKFGKLGELAFEHGSMRIYHVGNLSVSLTAR